MFDYIKSADTATKLIEQFGRTIQHVSVEEGDYVPGTGEVTDTTTTTDCKAVDFAYKGNHYDGNLVQAGDRYALIDASITNMDVSDQLIIGSDTWTIVNVEKLAPSGVLVMWKVQIRK